MAAFNLGMVASPFWGAFADRTGLHRTVYVVGLVVMAAGIGVFSLSSGVTWFAGTALVTAVAVSAVVTVADLFVTELHAEDTWPTCFGGCGACRP